MDASSVNYPLFQCYKRPVVTTVMRIHYQDLVKLERDCDFSAKDNCEVRNKLEFRHSFECNFTLYSQSFYLIVTAFELLKANLNLHIKSTL